MSNGLAEKDFLRLATIIEGHTGIRMPPSKRLMAEGRLRKRLRKLEIDSFDDYCHFLFDGQGLEEEFTHLVNAMTTNKTDFFREPEHFDFLARAAVPSLTGLDRAPGRRCRGPLKVWSAAASCGAEAYSIAMVLAELARTAGGPAFSILATDISTDVLEMGIQAVYPREMAAPIPPDMRQRYVMESRDPRREEVRIVPELRRTVRFQAMNLMDEAYPFDRDVDVIFCRNVLIYFKKSTQHEVLGRLCGHLRVGGYLFLGHSESMAGAHLPMRQMAATVFRRE